MVLRTVRKRSTPRVCYQICALGTPDEWLGVMPTDLDGGGGGRGVYVFARSLLNYLKKNGVCVHLLMQRPKVLTSFSVKYGHKR